VHGLAVFLDLRMPDLRQRLVGHEVRKERQRR
jgi:hypothetical protein